MSINFQKYSRFMRSVLPADPYQLLFLVATVLVFISPRLRWHIPNPNGIPIGVLIAVTTGALLLCSFAGCAAYYVCFWPGKNPVRRILLTVILPAIFGLIGFGAICGFANAPYESVLVHVPHGASKPSWIWPVIRQLPMGFQVCAAGIVLIIGFAWRVRRGRSRLPLALSRQGATADDDPEVWRQTRILVFLLVGVVLFAFGIVGIAIYAAIEALQTHTQQLAALLLRVQDPISAAILVGLAFWFARKDRESSLEGLRLPSPSYALLGVSLAVMVWAASPVAQFVVERVRWAMHDLGRFGPPVFWSRFDCIDPWLLLLFVGAFGEEVVFRGVLQTRFIDRYGAYRGIFLTGVVWAAIHFRSDTYGYTALSAFDAIGTRVALCLTFGFVLSWLTLKSRSIIPATLAHGANNLLVESQLAATFDFWWDRYLTIVLWGACAWILYSYWPLEDQPEYERNDSESPELAS